jgi:hypothetical protein
MSLKYISFDAINNQLIVKWEWDTRYKYDGLYVVWSKTRFPEKYNERHAQREYIPYRFPIQETRLKLDAKQTYFIALFGQYYQEYYLLGSRWVHIGYKMQIDYELSNMNRRQPQLILRASSFLHHSIKHDYDIPKIWIELNALNGNHHPYRLDIPVSPQHQKDLLSGRICRIRLNYAELAHHLPFSLILKTEKPTELFLQRKGTYTFNYRDENIVEHHVNAYLEIENMVNQGRSFIDIYHRFRLTRDNINHLYRLNWSPSQIFSNPLPDGEGFVIWWAIVSQRIHHDATWYDNGLELLKNIIKFHNNEHQIERLLQIIVLYGINKGEKSAYDFVGYQLNNQHGCMVQKSLMRLWLLANAQTRHKIFKDWLNENKFALLAFGILVEDILNTTNRDDFNLLREVILAPPVHLELSDCLKCYVTCKPFMNDILVDIHKWLNIHGLEWTTSPQAYLTCAIDVAIEYLQTSQPSDDHSKVFFKKIVDLLCTQPPLHEDVGSLLQAVILYIQRLPFSFNELSGNYKQWQQTIYHDLQKLLDNLLGMTNISDVVWKLLIDLGIWLSNPKQIDSFLRHWDVQKPNRMTDVLSLMHKIRYPITPNVVNTVCHVLNHPDTKPELRQEIYHVLYFGYFDENEAQFTEFSDAIMGYMRLKNELNEYDISFWCEHLLIERMPALVTEFAHVHLNLLIQIWEKLPHPLALELLVDRAIQTGGLSYLKAHVPKSEHFNRIHEFINTRLERDKIEERRQIIVQEWTTIYDRIGGGIPRILSAGGAAVAYGQFINLYDQANNESGQLAVRLRAIANELNFINELIRDIQQLCLDVQRIIEQLNLQNQALEQQHIAFQRAKNGIQNLNRRLDNLGTIENANVDAQRTDARQNNLEALRQLVATLQQMLNTSTTNPDSYKDQLIQLQSQESVYTHEQGLLNQQYHKLNEENNRLSARIELLAQLSEPVQELVTEIGRNHHEKQRISEQLNELRRQWQQHVADEIPVQIDAVRCKRQKRNRAIREDVNRLNQLTNVQNVNIHRPPMGNKGF